MYQVGRPGFGSGGRESAGRWHGARLVQSSFPGWRLHSGIWSPHRSSSSASRERDRPQTDAPAVRSGATLRDLPAGPVPRRGEGWVGWGPPALRRNCCPLPSRDVWGLKQMKDREHSEIMVTGLGPRCPYGVICVQGRCARINN